MTLKRFYLTLDMGYVVANIKTEAKEILEQDYDIVGLHIDGFSYTVIPHKEYNILTSTKKITRKDIEQWNESTEIHNKLVEEINGKKE